MNDTKKIIFAISIIYVTFFAVNTYWPRHYNEVLLQGIGCSGLTEAYCKNQEKLTTIYNVKLRRDIDLNNCVITLYGQEDKLRSNEGYTWIVRCDNVLAKMP